MKEIKVLAREIVEKILINLQFDCNVGLFSIEYLVEEIVPILKNFCEEFLKNQTKS